MAYVAEISDEDRPVADALKTGGALEAIKVYRALHDVDLASAKQAVEEIKSSLGL